MSISTEVSMNRPPRGSVGERRVNLVIAAVMLTVTLAFTLLGGIWIGYQFFWHRSADISRLDGEIAERRQTLQKDPTNFEALYQLGWSYYQKGDVHEALRYSAEAVRLQPEHAGALYNLGLAYFELKQHGEALTRFKSLADRYPRHELAWLSLGRTYLELGQNDAAVKTLQHTAAINPTSADIRFSLGTAYERTDDQQQAVAEYREALRYDPKYAAAATALRRLGVTDP